MWITLIKFFFRSLEVEMVQSTFSNQNAIIQGNLFDVNKNNSLRNQKCSLSTYKWMTGEKKKVWQLTSKTVHREKCMAPNAFFFWWKRKEKLKINKLKFQSRKLES